MSELGIGTATSLDTLNSKILIVDDREDNIELLQIVLQGAGYTSLSSTTDSRKVYELHKIHRYDLIVLDMNMPHMDGYDVMAALKPIESEGYLPILVVTAEPSHKLRALQAGAKDFMSDPFDEIEVLTRIHNMLEVRLLHKRLHIYNDELEQLVRERTADLEDSYRETIMTMTTAAEHRDEDTGFHIKRIGLYCVALAGKLGMDDKFIDEIKYASPMHDIGKLAIPDHVLLKPGPHTREEWEIMKTHAAAGAEILAEKKSPYLRMGAEIAMNHHERWNGSGYPRGLKGEAIPLPARIMIICDIYDALRSKRPYKPPFDHAKAIDTISRGDGRTEPAHFEPGILHAFLQNHETFRDIYEANAG